MSGHHGPTVRISLRKGRDLDFGAAPGGGPAVPAKVGAVALLGADYPGALLDPQVAEGEAVRLGQVLCRDRHDPRIAFVAPVAGRVRHTRRGKRRRLEALILETGSDGVVKFDTVAAQSDAAALRALMLDSGAWTGFRTRPFGHIPGPDTQPAAIFVTATDTNPLAADPLVFLTPQRAPLQAGLDALLRLTAGPVYLCQPAGPPLAEARDRLVIAEITGPHPAGNAGTQMHNVFPASADRNLWQIGAQDVAALGHLLRTGTVQGTRVVAVAGDGLRAPGLCLAPLGADLADLTRDHLITPGATLLSGAPLGGRTAQYLRRHDMQVTALRPSETPSGPFWRRFLHALPRARDGAMIPREAYDAAFPFAILPAPLMRALAVGDVETAERLGCLELLEEDMALLTWLCPSGLDYGILLRHVLDRLAEERSA